MIAFLRGRPAGAGPDYVVVDVGGVGYKVFVPTPVAGALADRREEVTLYTYLHVREDAMQLFGCLEEADLRVFELLIQVSGIGPKVALAVLSSMTAVTFIQAVINEQVNLLTRIPGVGRKTAQRVIIELKDKLGKMEASAGGEGLPLSPAGPMSDMAADALQALIALGYNPGEARKALGKAADGEPGALSTGDMVRRALKELSRI